MNSRDKSGEVGDAVLDKVVAFVVNASSGRLLVFEHPTAGLQLPKGTVEEGESLEDAVRREVFEETGVELSGVGRVLGADESTLEDGRGIILRTTPADGVTFRRGRYVDVLEAPDDSGHLRVREQHLDYGQSPPTVIRSDVGVVSAEKVARVVRRTFFLFRFEGESRGTWTREADGHVFEVGWRLLEGVELHAKQMPWLGAYREQIAQLI